MPEKIKSIPIRKLIGHPDNPNAMSKAKFRKLLKNIEMTGLYEPITVRPHPDKKDCFQIINGHQRLRAIEKLGEKRANCIIWDVNDEQTSILLMSLNRLCGCDCPSKKIELLKKITGQISSAQLSKLIPLTAKQIDRLINLKLPDIHIMPHVEQFAVPLVFFVSKQQKEIIEKAISNIETNRGRRAQAITKMAESICQKIGFTN